MPDHEQLPVPEARAGDARAWDVLFKRYQLPLYAYVFELVRSEQTALDIVQETFINGVRHIGRLAEDHKFGSWLFSIAHQKCIQQWRKGTPGRPEPEEILAGLPDENPLPDQLLIREEEQEAFMKAVGQLDPAHRSVVLLHFFETCPLEEIAAITGTPLGTVKSRLHYAKKRLKLFLQEVQA